MDDNSTPNTITSPQQGGVRDILQAATANAPTTKDIAIFNTPSVRALMKGLTDAKSQGDATKKAQEIAAAPTPEITTKTKIDRATGQTVHDITVTNFQPGNAQDEVQKAYDAPKANLQKYESAWDEERRKRVATMGAALDAHNGAATEQTPADGGSGDVAARQADLDARRQNKAKDYHLDAPGADGKLPADVSTNETSFLGRYRLERQSGEGRLHALVKAAAISALPQHEKDAITAEVGNAVDRRRKETVDAYLKRDLPLDAEYDRQSRLNAENRRLGGLETRDSERRVRDIIAKTDFSQAGLDTPDARLESVANQFGVDASKLPAWVGAQVERKTRQDSEAYRSRKVSDFRKDRPALGQFATFDAAKTSLGVPMNDTEQKGAMADWQAAREDTVRGRQNEYLKAAAAQRAANAEDRAASRFSQGKPVDAGKLIRGTLTPEALVSYKGNARYDQDSVEGAIAAGAEHYAKAIDDRIATVAGYNQILASAPDNPTDTQAKALDKARFEARKLIRANVRDQMALDTLRGAAPAQRQNAAPAATPAPANAPAAAAPRVGDRKKFPNGNIGEWDGRGWALVR